MCQDEYDCPQCGCSHTTRIPVEILSSDTKQLWFAIALFSALGVTISPLIFLLALAAAILSLIIGIVGKIRSRSVWDMQCARCGHVFSIPSPTAQMRQTRKAESKKAQAMVRLQKAQQLEANETYNGQLLEGEVLLNPAFTLGVHKSFFRTENYHVKCTDNGLLFYNAQGAFRLSWQNVKSIHKKNYFFCIPTGLCITAHSPTTGKAQKYSFVVMPTERDSLINTLKEHLPTHPL